MCVKIAYPRSISRWDSCDERSANMYRR